MAPITARAGLRPEDEPAGLLDGLAELDGFGQEAYCLFNVDDRVDRVLKEWGEFEDTQGKAGRVVAFHDRETPLPVASHDELVKRGAAPASFSAADPPDRGFQVTTNFMAGLLRQGPVS